MKHILENQVYGLAPTPILQGITQSYIFGFDAENMISRKNFIQHDLTPQAQNNTAKQKLQQLFKLNENMKFDAVVGNPPYQENISNFSDNSSLSKQIFPLFIEAGINLEPRYLSFITPSRWFTGDAQDKSFLKLRDFIKQNNNFKRIVNFPNSKNIFSDVEISGGVNYFLIEKGYNGLVDFIEYYDSDNIVELQRPLFEEGLDIILSSGRNYQFIQKLKEINFTSMT
ncbi:MAG: hypothetical protein EAZ95_01420, partial [Bacteroidetes bacterium]